MKRCLVMLTTAFPFADGEAYLEAEVPILAKRFAHIFLFTIGLDPGVAPTIPMPENVTVCNCATAGAKKEKILDVLHGLPAVLFAPALPSADLREAGRSAARRAFLGYFLARTKRHAAEIGQCIQCMDFSAFDEVIVYSYWLFAAASTAAALKPILLRQGAGSVRLISRAHGYDIYAQRNALSYLPCRTMLLQNMDAVYACSENGREYLAARYGEYADKLHTAYLGAADGKRTDGSSDGVLRIVTCGRVIPLKRYERVADALRLLPDGRRAEWTHIGDGPAMGLLRKKIETLPGNITVSLTGALPHEQLLRYYRTHTADAFVSVSSSEGLPVSAMEAMSFGIPVVVTDVGGCTELLDGEANGTLLPADFTDVQLRDAILRVAAGGSAARDAAFRVWQTRFDAKQNYERFAALLCNP